MLNVFYIILLFYHVPHEYGNCYLCNINNIVVLEHKFTKKIDKIYLQLKIFLISHLIHSCNSKG